VEERVDGEIRRVSQSMRRAVWNILQDVGWCALAQVGDVVGLVKAMIPSGEDSGRDDGRGDRIHAQVRHDQQQKNDDDDDSDNHGDDVEDAKEDDGEEEASEDEPDEKLEVIELPIHYSEITPVSSYASMSSLRESFRCCEDEDYLEGDSFANTKSYLRDLAQMLQNGLYVFASYNKCKSGSNDDTDDIASCASNCTATKSFRLSVFSYHPALSTSPTMGNDNKNLQHSYHDCFVFGPKPSHPQMTESQSEQMAKDSAVLPVKDVVQVRKVGTHAIEFVTASSSTPESQRLQRELQPTLTASFASGSMLRSPSICSNMSEDDFVTIMKSCSSIDGGTGSGNILQQQAVDEEEEEEFIFAEMILSDGEDRDTIFAGLKILLKNFCDDGKEDNDYEDIEKEVEGVKLDDASEVEEDMNVEDVAEEGNESQEESSPAKIQDEVGGVRLDDASEVEEDMNVEDAEEEEGNESEEEESSTKLLHGDELVRTPDEKGLLENIQGDQNTTPDYDNFLDESSIVDELVVQASYEGQHSTNPCEKQEQLGDSSENSMLWGHGKMADDQELSEEERNKGDTDSNQESMKECDDKIVDWNDSHNVKETSSIADERLENSMASRHDNDATPDCSDDELIKNGTNIQDSQL